MVQRLLSKKGHHVKTLDSSKSLGEQMMFDLFCKIVADSAVRYPLGIRDVLSKDLMHCRARFDDEGFGFLSITLPRVGKALDRALELGRFELPRGLSRDRDTALPIMFGSLFELVFRQDGTLLDHPDVIAIKQLRQILFFGYRYALPYTQEQQNAVLDSFKATEEEISQLVFGEHAIRILDEARDFVLRSLYGFDPKDILPRHGPGAVATGERGELKWTFARLYDSIHQFYPYYDYFVVGRASELADRRKWYFSLERRKSGTAKVVLVPKDSRGPRLISCEPLEYQYIQQGLGRAIVAHLSTSKWTRGNVNFHDQSINQRLAIDSSVDQRLCTIDMKDASDRVSLQLVRYLFPEEVFRALLATRSTATVLPNGETVSLDKFAPMGSALCFPVEALCFWAICSAVVRQVTGCTATWAANAVKVYGDDIICPSYVFDDVVRALSSVGCKVNEDKCFVNGKFRESCGVDAYDGIDVTPTKIRTVWSGNPRDAGCYASFLAYANDFKNRGYHHAATYIYDCVESVYGKVPYGTARSSYPCREISCPDTAELLNEALVGIRTRYNTRLQRYEFCVKYLAIAKLPTSLESWPRLLRDLTAGAGEQPNEVVVPRTTYIKHGWRPIY